MSRSRVQQNKLFRSKRPAEFIKLRIRRLYECPGNLPHAVNPKWRPNSLRPSNRVFRLYVFLSFVSSEFSSDSVISPVSTLFKK